jgi:hypothetical protein
VNVIWDLAVHDICIIQHILAEDLLLFSADGLLVDGALQRATEIMDANSDLDLVLGPTKLLP